MACRGPTLLVALLGLALAPSAQASTASFTPSSGCPGQSCRLARVDVVGDAAANVLEVAVSGGATVVRDGGSRLEAGPGCTGQPDGSVSCGVGRLTVRGAEGDDRLVWTGTEARAFGGYGDDELDGAGELRGGPGTDVLTGSDGGDALFGGPGTDRAVGGGGDDVLFDTVDPRRDEPAPEENEPQADLLDGGAGVDWLVFQARAEPLVVDLTAAPQVAGARGERNSVARIELATGARRSDRMRLGPVPRGFRPGDDERAPLYLLDLNAGAGDDRITLAGPLGLQVVGGRGDDVLRGSRGRDDLEGDAGDDLVDGGGGNDVVADFSGRDVLLGGPGNDRVESMDTFDFGRDRVDCGTGRRDFAEHDRRDRLRRCERTRLFR